MREDDILEFDVAVDDHLGVHVVDAPGDFPDHDGGGLLGETPPLLQ